MIDINKLLNELLDDVIDAKIAVYRKEVDKLRALPLVRLSELLEEEHFVKVVKAIVDAELAPFREQLEKL